MNAQPADRKSPRPVLIAVVDDEASVRRALSRLLRAVGFEARAFATGREFLETCCKEPPDCVVLDLHMPGMSGLEVLRRMNESGLLLPTVLITADDEPGRCERPCHNAVVASLRKPVDGPDLIQQVEHAVLLGASVHAPNARVTVFSAH